jgi:hypothetical protein
VYFEALAATTPVGLSQKSPELLPPAAADSATVVRLKKIHEEKNQQHHQPPSQIHLSRQESVLTSGATP